MLLESRTRFSKSLFILIATRTVGEERISSRQNSTIVEFSNKQKENIGLISHRCCCCRRQKRPSEQKRPIKSRERRLMRFAFPRACTRRNIMWYQQEVLEHPMYLLWRLIKLANCTFLSAMGQPLVRSFIHVYTCNWQLVRNNFPFNPFSNRVYMVRRSIYFIFNFLS